MQALSFIPNDQDKSHKISFKFSFKRPKMQVDIPKPEAWKSMRRVSVVSTQCSCMAVLLCTG